MGKVRDNRIGHGQRSATNQRVPPINSASQLQYELLLSKDSRWALSEGSLFFEGKGAVQESLRRIVKRLDELAIPYAVVGGLALFSHGFRRFTEDVDILVTPQGLTSIHKELDGLGYVPPFIGSKHLRDTISGVKIEFLVTGQFPGDGKPKPLPFPDPASVAVEIDGIKYLNLPTLIDLKLASGMTNPDRAKDLVDIQELIKTANLSRNFSDQLNLYVRSKYIELWDTTRAVKRRFIRIWRNKFLTIDVKTIEEMIRSLREAEEELAAMLADGVTLDSDSGIADDYALLVTENPDVALKYDMHDEKEFWDGREKEPDGEDVSDNPAK